ncbi:MAG: M14 family zinc carboxypeptidase [Candidatus Thermoplasmatota archaeon]
MRALAVLVFIVVSAFLALPLVSPAVQALPTPGFNCDLSDPLLGRVFPEPEETNDYVSYDEALCGFKKLETQFPDWIHHDVIGKSVGWGVLTGGHEQFDVFVVHVTNGKSSVPSDQKIRILFQLSIHGNEKGGREGGMRVIEDLVRDIGMTKEHPELRADLDYMEMLFVFPNPDGWTHEEAEYRANDACYLSLTPECTAGKPGLETQNFVRVNGHGKDLNRQWPTVGWQRAEYQAMGEPEATALVAYLKNVTNIKYASDIHGMLNPADGTTASACFNAPMGVPQPDPNDLDPTCFENALQGSKGHYILTLLPAGEQDPREVEASTALAQLVKERLNGDPYFVDWSSVPSLQGAWGGEFNDWGTVWDTIGYTDSGISSDFYAQDHGLNAPGVDFEMAYNHITFDNYYPGVGMLMNRYHVQAVRDIVRAFMDEAALDVQMSIDTKGTRSAFVENPTIVTNAGNMTVAGWPDENPADDAFDTAHRVYQADPNDYFRDIQALLVDGEKPGILDGIRADDITIAKLRPYTNLVVAGSAAKSLQDKPPALDAIRKWTEAGGNLVLTDSALALMQDLGVVDAGSVDLYHGYAGATNFADKKDPLSANVLGLARQTYEPVPLGYGLDKLSAPVWFVKASAFKGDIVGYAGMGQGAQTDTTMVNFGRAPLGLGKVTFLGALLPDPTAQNGAPYGLDSYATTYTGNQLLRNALGWDVKSSKTPTSPDALGVPGARVEGGAITRAGDASSGGGSPSDVPGLELLGVIGAVAVVAALRRR